MRNRVIILFIYLSITSCRENSSVKTTKNIDTPTTLHTSESMDNDTLIINTTTAVFTDPDSLQIEKRKKEIGEENFYAGSGDYIYYLNSAHEFLDSVKVKTIIVKGTKIIKFVSYDKSYQLIQTDTLPELWNIFLFNPNKRVKQIDMTIIDEEYKNYFKQE